MRTSFLSLPIGAHFNFNSNEYIKKSTRTAFLIEFNRVFYFSNSELVKIINLKG